MQNTVTSDGDTHTHTQMEGWGKGAQQCWPVDKRDKKEFKFAQFLVKYPIYCEFRTKHSEPKNIQIKDRKSNQDLASKMCSLLCSVAKLALLPGQ